MNRDESMNRSTLTKYNRLYFPIYKANFVEIFVMVVGVDMDELQCFLDAGFDVMIFNDVNSLMNSFSSAFLSIEVCDQNADPVTPYDGPYTITEVILYFMPKLGSKKNFVSKNFSKNCFLKKNALVR